MANPSTAVAPLAVDRRTLAARWAGTAGTEMAYGVVAGSASATAPCSLRSARERGRLHHAAAGAHVRGGHAPAPEGGACERVFATLRRWDVRHRVMGPSS